MEFPSEKDAWNKHWLSWFVSAARAVIVRPPRSQRVDIFDSVSLHCAAEGRPAPSVTWTRSDEDGQTAAAAAAAVSGGGRFSLLDNGTLVIQGSRTL